MRGATLKKSGDVEAPDKEVGKKEMNALEARGTADPKKKDSARSRNSAHRQISVEQAAVLTGVAVAAGSQNVGQTDAEVEANKLVTSVKTSSTLNRMHTTKPVIKIRQASIAEEAEDLANLSNRSDQNTS